MPFGAVYATVDCLFHDDAEHISHGVEIASDYKHTHDSISLDSEELLFLSSSGQNLGDTAIEEFIDNQCSSGLMLTLSVDNDLLITVDSKDPFSHSDCANSLVSNLIPQEIRPPKFTLQV